MLIGKNKILQLLTIIVSLLIHSSINAAEEFLSKSIIGNFSSGHFGEWKDKELKGHTEYQFEKVEGVWVVKALSQDSASGLFYERAVDLEKTPFINWRWRIDRRLSGSNEKEKSGDDFSARIYLIKSGGLLIWKSKALNYVWSAAAKKDESWPNPFAGKSVMMLALRTSADSTGIWVSEKRNLREDFKRLLGEDIRTIDAVAVMTDTDNSHGYAIAYYGDIYFSAH